MPLTKSAKKKLKQDEKREILNDTLKRSVKKGIHRYKRNPSPKLLSALYSLFDTAAKRKVFHVNKAARLKSRLTKYIDKKISPVTPNTGIKRAKKSKRPAPLPKQPKQSV